MKHATGSCLCKAVQVRFELVNDYFDVCHCGMCRKWNGGPVFSVDSKGKPEIQGEEFISVYDSSEWAERGFCKKCGTHLFYRLKEKGFMNFSLGILDQQEQFEFHQQIFVDMKPNNYNFAEQTKMLTQEEVFAKYY